VPLEPLPPLTVLLLRSVASLRRQPASVPPEIGLAAHFEIDDIDLAHVTKYRAFFADDRQQVPLTYFYLLAQRAQVALMLDRRFPHAVPGLIHIRNRMRLHAPYQLACPLEIQVSVSSGPRSADAGSIDFNVEMTQSGQRIMTCVSAYRVPGMPRRSASGETRPESLPESFVRESWSFDPSLGRRYAMLSRDFNPIHLSSLLARAFGCKRAIAHGMYAIGRAAARIERHTGKPLIEIAARFRRPIPLPSLASFGFESSSSTGGNFSVILAPEQQLAIEGSWSVG